MKSIRMIGAAILGLGMASAAAAQSSDPISQSAAVYATYQSEVTDVKTKQMGAAGDIDDALTQLGGHNPDQLSRGWIAYSALIASQNPEYRAAVRDIESFYGKDALLTGLRNDVSYARKLGGGDTAVSAALSATAADSNRLNSAAAYVKEQAYSLQGQGWAKAKLGAAKSGKVSGLNSSQARGIPAKSSLVSAFSAADIDSVLAQAGATGAPSLWDNVTGAASAVRFPSAVRSGLTGSRKRVKYGQEPIADQIATLAAYRVMGDSSSATGQISAAMSERKTQACMNMANLNLQQCVAAANQQYEVPFCIGEHALADVGKCIGGVYQ